MALYTSACRHLSSFYHKSGYHQSWPTIVFILNDLHNLASSVALLGICICSFVGPLCFNEYLERNYGVVEKVCVLLMVHPSVLDDIFKLTRKVNDEKLIEYQG